MTSSATATPSAIGAAAMAIQDWIVARRRFLHQNPELSFREEQTAKYIERELKWLGFTRIHTRLSGNYSICAELLGRDRGRCVALRADMDALPIQEETESPYKSRVDGVSHMCGHDAHTAMLLGAARILKEREADLPRTVRFFFQGAEELPPGGALDFLNAGMLEGVDEVFGLHVKPQADTGTLQLVDGRYLAGVELIDIHIIGKGGHAAIPHDTRDPVLAACHVVTAFQQVVSRLEDPFQPSVLSLTSIHGGEAFNVIPNEVTLKGTLRSFRVNMREHFLPILRRIAESVAAGFGCEARLEMSAGYPPLINDPGAAGKVRRTAADIFPGGVEEGHPIMASEDFAHYTQHAPAAFAFLGVAAPADTERHGLHHPRFHIDEDALWRGSALLAALAFA